MWNYDYYKDWLKDRLVEIKNNLDFKDFNVEVYNEQDYAKNRSIKAKTITVIVKFLADNKIFSAKTQPIQMLVITEENGLSVANSIITKFCDTYNFAITTNGTTYIKHMYSSPVPLSNFNLIGIGLRTVLYVNTTLFILEDVRDINNLKIDNKSVDAMSITIGYTMSGDTQPFDGGFAKTVKNFSTFVMTVNVACVKNDFTDKCIGIMKGNSTNKGNETFVVSFDVGKGSDKISFSLNMKMTGGTLTTAVNNVPSLQLSFSV